MGFFDDWRAMWMPPLQPGGGSFPNPAPPISPELQAILTGTAPQAQAASFMGPPPTSQFWNPPSSAGSGGGPTSEEEQRQADLTRNFELEQQALETMGQARTRDPFSQTMRDFLDARVPGYFNENQGARVGTWTGGMLGALVGSQAGKVPPGSEGRILNTLFGPPTPTTPPPTPDPLDSPEARRQAAAALAGQAPWSPTPPFDPTTGGFWGEPPIPSFDWTDPSVAPPGSGSGSGVDSGGPTFGDTFTGGYEFRRGGPIPNRGAPRRDPVQITAHEGEFVVRPEMAAKYRAFLEMLNAGRL